MEQTQHPYDPKDVRRYFGTSFQTIYRKVYRVDFRGQFEGPRVNGAQIEMIAGIEGKHYRELKKIVEDGKNIREKVKRILIEHGQEADRSLQLLVMFTENSASAIGLDGFLTDHLLKVTD